MRKSILAHSFLFKINSLWKEVGFANRLEEWEREGWKSLEENSSLISMEEETRLTCELHPNTPLVYTIRTGGLEHETYVRISASNGNIIARSASIIFILLVVPCSLHSGAACTQSIRWRGCRRTTTRAPRRNETDAALHWWTASGATGARVAILICTLSAISYGRR